MTKIIIYSVIALLMDGIIEKIQNFSKLKPLDVVLQVLSRPWW